MKKKVRKASPEEPQPKPEMNKAKDDIEKIPDPETSRPSNELPAKAVGILEAIGCRELGDGNLSVGINTLVVMACTLASLAPPGSGIISTRGVSLSVGQNLLVGGSHSKAVIEDTVFGRLRDCQRNLTNHLWDYSEYERRAAAYAREVDHLKGIALQSSVPLLRRLDSLGPRSEEPIRPNELFSSSAPVHVGTGARHAAFFVEGTDPATLANLLPHAHSGKILARLNLNQASDMVRLERTFYQIRDGFTSHRNGAFSVKGDVIACIPAEILPALLGASSSTLPWVRELICLSDEEVAADHNTSPTHLPALLTCFREAMMTRLEKRFRDAAPKLIEIDFGEKHNNFVRKLAALERGGNATTGTHRNFFATLAFGLSHFVSVPPMRELLYLCSPLAIWLVRRSLNTFQKACGLEDQIRIVELGRSILMKIGPRPASVREIQRRFHELSSSRCYEGLAFLESNGLIEREGNRYKLCLSLSESLEKISQLSS